MKSAEDNCVSNGLIKRMKPEHILLLDSKVPKQFISFDEQYLRRCLEFIQISANKPTSCSLDSDITVFTESKSILDILNSPLFHKFGSTVGDKASLVDLRRPKYSSCLSSPGGSHSTKSGNLEKDMAVHNNHVHGSNNVLKSFSPISSTISSGADQSSSSVAASTSHWMLHNKGNPKNPRYVFSFDDESDSYIANLLKVDSPNNEVTNYMYTFHSRAGNRKEDGIHQPKLKLVGKMRVSTSVTILSDATEVMETLFVLFGFDNNSVEEIQTRSHNLTKSKGFSGKMSDVLKASRTFRRRSSMKLDVSISAKEINSTHPCHQGRLEDHFPPNLELAAIVVKERISHTNNSDDVGGWGLKFLNKIGHTHANSSLEADAPSQCRSHSDADCSTSINVIIPAGFHGVPRSKNSGPSSLIDRWILGGKCDCGGWDIGCALTVLKTKQTEALPQAKNFDIFAEGSKKVSHTMKIVNIHAGSYCIPFQSTLSALQSFSIAVAILHSQTHSPNLRHQTSELGIRSK